MLAGRVKLVVDVAAAGEGTTTTNYWITTTTKKLSLILRGL